MQEPPLYSDQELVSSSRGATSFHKVPPHSIEAEQSVLGSLLFNNSAWYTIADRLSEYDFYRPDHRLIFKAIKMLAEMGQPCDVITLSEWLIKQNKLENVGGIAYLGMLADSTPSAANITAYADIVREKSILRELIHVGSRIMDSAFQYEGHKPTELLENAEKLVFEIAEKGARSGGGFREIKEILTKTLDQIDILYQSGNSITGVPTGFKDFDEQTSGLQRSDLIIVAGRPSMGKTSFAMNIAEYVAIQAKHPVAVFSMEMPCEQLAMRLISSLARINQQNVRTGKLEDHDWTNITSAISLLSESPLFIDDTPALNPTELRARARRLASEHGQLGLIVIDYLQLMQVPDSRENRATEVSEISRGLKALAKELHVPVIALSQLNRSLEQRPNKRPVMSDLRESGSIEQDADLIIFIYRDEVYNQDSEDKGTAEIIVAKQRNGPIGTVRLTFLGHLTRFENFSPMDYYHGEH
ncbi:replicative DNA helicase [Beggiatoa alba B18LD]|uniref:Replicative DNA helicase n=1 Tax=Beggiatoa alba B18LD TaxID=395493 RepID=I3CK42_9GAMM|nr:replicative DNA helicase [Beggiatoa alba]EIJ43985.1 replicative DNA helicase [Beggiatoa alba B18LD]